MPLPNTSNTRPCKHGHVSARDSQGKCPECRLRWDANFAAKHPSYRTKYMRGYSRKNPERMLWQAARDRARRDGYEHTITIEDINIPEFCPLLGIRLERGEGIGGVQGSSPTLDKITPKLGYIKGNVWVISARANTLKNDATLQELQMLVANLAKAMRKFPWEAS